MDAQHYLSTIVAPTIAEYATERTSVRRAFLACVAAFHMIDYLAESKRPATVRSQVRSECPSFILIDRVANAFKHKSTGSKGGPIKPLKPDWVQPRPPAIFGQMVFGVSLFGDGVGGLTISGSAGADLYSELRNVLAYFQTRIRAK